MRNEDRGKPPKKFEDNELQTLLDEDDTQTQQELADQLNVSQKAVSIRLESSITRKTTGISKEGTQSHFSSG